MHDKSCSKFFSCDDQLMCIKNEEKRSILFVSHNVYLIKRPCWFCIAEIVVLTWCISTFSRPFQLNSCFSHTIIWSLPCISRVNMILLLVYPLLPFCSVVFPIRFALWVKKVYTLRCSCQQHYSITPMSLSGSHLRVFFLFVNYSLALYNGSVGSC